MEILFIYLIKSSGLIGMFYLAYYFLLRKETFFTSNRWFLLAGLITSVILPLLVFTKIIWVEPTPTNFGWSDNPVTIPVEQHTYEINWYLVLGIAYMIGIVVFLLKFAFDFYSLTKVLKGKTIQQQADFKFIDVAENVSPFSYFDYIVYNSALYSQSELENILEHEKVHSTQNHTVDVLIARFFCVAFWYNPFVWLYKKAILQNLEFIADNEASKKISDKKAYQITLLKVTTHENCVAITNHFYQSLIKKRIVMLNKNQSNKRNSLKYALVLPVLAAFVIFFQVEVIAQEKLHKKQEITNTENVTFVDINKNSTDEEMKKDAEILKKEHGIILKFSKIKRNSNGEITAIKVEYTDKNGSKGVSQIEGKEPIKPIQFYKNDDKIGFGSPREMRILKHKKEEADSADEKDFEFSFNEDDIADIDAPEPPTPPATPNLPEGLLSVPAFDMSDMPAPPAHPTNVHDKKAMAKFEQEMSEFEKKMEAFEPDMTAYAEQIEKEMTKNGGSFEKEMKKFEEKMKVFEAEMEVYQKKIHETKTKKNQE